MIRFLAGLVFGRSNMEAIMVERPDDIGYTLVMAPRCPDYIPDWMVA